MNILEAVLDIVAVLVLGCVLLRGVVMVAGGLLTMLLHVDDEETEEA